MGIQVMAPDTADMGTAGMATADTVDTVIIGTATAVMVDTATAGTVDMGQGAMATATVGIRGGVMVTADTIITAGKPSANHVPEEHRFGNRKALAANN